jgi:hypothetical protein
MTKRKVPRLDSGISISLCHMTKRKVPRLDSGISISLHVHTAMNDLVLVCSTVTGPGTSTSSPCMRPLMAAPIRPLVSLVICEGEAPPGQCCLRGSWCCWNSW